MVEIQKCTLSIRTTFCEVSPLNGMEELLAIRDSRTTRLNVGMFVLINIIFFGVGVYM